MASNVWIVRRASRADLAPKPYISWFSGQKGDFSLRAPRAGPRCPPFASENVYQGSTLVIPRNELLNQNELWKFKYTSLGSQKSKRFPRTKSSPNQSGESPGWTFCHGMIRGIGIKSTELARVAINKQDSHFQTHCATGVQIEFPMIGIVVFINSLISIWFPQTF